jgi:hypothetical protein
MSTRRFLRLPIEPDQGFPQAFRLEFGGRIYRVTLYVNTPEPVTEPPDDEVLDLGDDVTATNASMVMRVVREGGPVEQVVFQRKVVTGVEYDADELAFVFRTIKVARRNLNGVGPAGSEVTAGIGAGAGGYHAVPLEPALDG